MGFLSGLGSLFHHSANNGKLAPGNGQWAQLANFYPEDSGVGDKFKGGKESVDPASVLAALGGLGGSMQPPPAPPPMQFAPMPQQDPTAMLQGAPRIGQQQMMGPPQAWQPYMWGGR